MFRLHQAFFGKACKIHYAFAVYIKHKNSFKWELKSYTIIEIQNTSRKAPFYIFVIII
jgi:hypothetical protein